MPHLVATLIYLSQIYSYYIRGDGSPLKQVGRCQYAIVNEHFTYIRQSSADVSHFVCYIAAKGIATVN